MNNTKQYLDQQEAIQLQNRIVSFMRDCKIGTLLHKNGIRKLRGDWKCKYRQTNSMPDAQ